MGNKLKRDLKGDFDKEGFIAIKGFIPSHELQEIRQKMEEFIDQTIGNMPSEHVFYEDKSNPSTLKQLQHIDHYHPFFDKLIRNKRIVGLAEDLLGNTVVAKNLQWFNKPPRIGKETPAHQDGYYFMLEPNEAVTMWLALDFVNEENGCVRYLPGSHKGGMRPHGQTKVLGFSQGILDYTSQEMATEKPMVVDPGDIIVHHSLTIHRADNNSSQRTRKGLGFIFYSSEAKEDKVKQKAYQNELKADLLRQNKI